jgi:hypothetical protein
MDGTIINDLVDERGWEVVFGTSVVDIAKFYADANSFLFFVKKDKVEDPRSVHNGVNETSSA